MPNIIERQSLLTLILNICNDAGSPPLAADGGWWDPEPPRLKRRRWADSTINFDSSNIPAGASGGQ
jgi:hypothetical protein